MPQLLMARVQHPYRPPSTTKRIETSILYRLHRKSDVLPPTIHYQED